MTIQRRQSRIFIETLRQLLDGGAVGSWRWISRLRRAERAERQLWLQVLQAQSRSLSEAKTRSEETDDETH